MSKNLAAWTETPSTPSDRLVQYVSINQQPDGQVQITVRDAFDSITTAIMPWADYVRLVSECNVSIAKDAGRSQRR